MKKLNLKDKIIEDIEYKNQSMEWENLKDRLKECLNKKNWKLELPNDQIKHKKEILVNEDFYKIEQKKTKFIREIENFNKKLSKKPSKIEKRIINNPYYFEKCIQEQNIVNFASREVEKEKEYELLLNERFEGQEELYENQKMLKEWCLIEKILLEDFSNDFNESINNKNNR